MGKQICPQILFRFSLLQFNEYSCADEILEGPGITWAVSLLNYYCTILMSVPLIAVMALATLGCWGLCHRL